MSWHPALGSPDPAAAWFGDDQLAEQREAEYIDAVIRRRNLFQAAVGRLTNPTPEDIKSLWQRAHKEAFPDVTAD